MENKTKKCNFRSFVFVEAELLNSAIVAIWVFYETEKSQRESSALKTNDCNANGHQLSRSLCVRKWNNEIKSVDWLKLLSKEPLSGI